STSYLLLSCTFPFFFTTPATPALYTLSLHDALPICLRRASHPDFQAQYQPLDRTLAGHRAQWPAGVAGSRPSAKTRSMLCRSRKDRKSTRLNSSHDQISYAVFCLKKKNKSYNNIIII